MRISLRQLEVIQAVAETGSVTAAAKCLNISQPSVSRYLHEIEQSHAVVLFDRTPRGSIPTTAGMAFLQRARAVTAELHALEDDVRALRGSSIERLAIGITPAVIFPVPRAITRLLESSPNVSIELIEDMRAKLLPALRAGDLDLVLATRLSDGPGDGLIDRVLFYNRLRVVARWEHPLGEHRTIPITMLRDYDWVLPPADLPPRQQLETAFHQANLRFPQRVISVSSARMQRELLLFGDFLSIMVGEAVQADVALKLIRLLDVDLVLPTRPIALVTRRNSHPSFALTRFIEFLTEEAERDQDVEKNGSIDVTS